MTAPSNHHDASLDLLAHNQAAWDQQAAQDCEWSRPVTPEIIAAARGGDLSAARLTPERCRAAGWTRSVACASCAWLAPAASRRRCWPRPAPMSPYSTCPKGSWTRTAPWRAAKGWR